MCEKKVVFLMCEALKVFTVTLLIRGEWIEMACSLAFFISFLLNIMNLFMVIEKILM